MTETKALRIAFVHPDLGIGGAERLVVDAAVGLQRKGHKVVVYTSHHDPKHCFEETRDGTLEVRVRGDTIIRRNLFGYLYIVCAILRQLHLTISLLRDGSTYDVLFVDQLSTNIPLMRWKDAKVFFFCHFPDKLLATRGSLLKRAYRAPIDALEELTTACADSIVVNSKFTQSIFKQNFPHIHREPTVLYPGIDLSSYDGTVNEDDQSVAILKSSCKIFVSINRFERKKNIALAVQAFAKLRDILDAKSFAAVRLIIAGGYDPRVTENLQHLEELQKLCKSFDLSHYAILPNELNAPPIDTSVVFLCSFTTAQRTFLLREAQVLLYTPTNEHFGIVPIEAMYAQVPVLSTDSGGPRETVIDGETGYRKDENDIQGWADCMKRIAFDKPQLKVTMGKTGRQHVLDNFSLEAFVAKCDSLLQSLHAQKTIDDSGDVWFWAIATLIVLLSVYPVVRFTL